MAGLSTASPQAIRLAPSGFPGFPFLSLPDGTSNKKLVEKRTFHFSTLDLLITQAAPGSDRNGKPTGMRTPNTFGGSRPRT